MTNNLVKILNNINRQILATVFCLLSFTDLCFAQKGKQDCPVIMDSLSHRLIYTFGERLPEPKGGAEQILTVISKGFKFPPGSYAGTVVLKFIVEANGTLTGLTIIKDPSEEQGLFGKPIFELIKKINWIPGKCNSKRVPMYYTLPISCIMPVEDRTFE